MSAKSRLFLLLVVSLIGIIFALIPASEAETSFEIEQLVSSDSNVPNEIILKVNNSHDKEITYSLSVDILSEDLQENIILETPNKMFTISSNHEYLTNFTFSIPASGKYNFNFTLLENNEGKIEIFYLDEIYLFYQNQNIDLELIVEDYYLDLNGGTKWQYNEYENKIEVINLEEIYNTSIVLGPFITAKKTNNIIEINNDFSISNTSDYNIAYTSNFDKTQLYRTQWTEVYNIEQETGDKIELNIEESAEIFIRLQTKDSEGDSTNYWDITGINHKFVTMKHNLVVTVDEHYFYNIEENPELFVNIANIGTFDQQIGNISVNVELYYLNEHFESYSKSLAIQKDQSQTIDFRFLNMENPGNYYCKISTIIINEDIFSSNLNSFISFSTMNLGPFGLEFTSTNELALDTESNTINLLIEIEDTTKLIFNSMNETIPLFDDFYVIKISGINQKMIIQSEDSAISGRIVSAIVMDEYKFNAYSEEDDIETIEGIIAPTIYFEKPDDYYANVIIDNEGFHKEEYDITYIFASTFVSSVEGPSKITVDPSERATISIKINPLEVIPREGGSQLNIEISNREEAKIITYVLSYKNTEIVILENKCDRNSLLVGQGLSCDTVITNRGYISNELEVKIGSVKNSETNVIEKINIGILKNGELWTLRTNYIPEMKGSYQIFVEVYDESKIVASYQSDDEIKAIEMHHESDEKTGILIIPKIDLTNTIITMSTLGLVYQFRRSENFKYMTFKFFLPLYSRLQKDTLADEPTRQNLLQHIYSAPGSNFKQLKERFDLHNGTLSHHINILENHNMITSHRSGRQRLFFPFGTGNSLETRTALITNKTQKEIVKIVKTNPGITQSMISQRLSVSRQKINYHVNSLATKAYLKIEKQGRITRLYPTHFT